MAVTYDMAYIVCIKSLDNEVVSLVNMASTIKTAMANEVCIVVVQHS